MHSPASNFDKDPYKVKCHIRAQCRGVGRVTSGTLTLSVMRIPPLFTSLGVFDELSASWQVYCTPLSDHYHPPTQENFVHTDLSDPLPPTHKREFWLKIVQAQSN